MRYFVLVLICGLVSPALAEDEHGPMPKLPGDLCEKPRQAEVCCPYFTVDTETGERLWWPLYVGRSIYVNEAYRRDYIYFERDYSRPCKARI